MPRKQSPQRSRSHAKQAGILRAVADELGITTPEAADRPRRKGAKRVKVYKAEQR